MHQKSMQGRKNFERHRGSHRRFFPSLLALLMQGAHSHNYFQLLCPFPVILSPIHSPSAHLATPLADLSERHGMMTSMIPAKLPSTVTQSLVLTSIECLECREK